MSWQWRAVGTALGIALTFVAALPAPAAATLPGPNGKIAFTSDRDGSDALWVMGADGSGQTLLHAETVTSFYPPYPAWSPDGREIAFTREYWLSRSMMDLFVMEADGGNVRQITFDDFSGISPTWSPDGEQIAFTSFARLFVTTAAPGGDVVLISEPGPDEYDNFPDWSQDGEKIAFSRTTIAGTTVLHSHLLVVDPGGGAPQALTSGSHQDLTPSISPGGETIVFSSDRSGRPGDLYTIPVTGGTPTQLTDTPGFAEEDPVWSPDGTKVAFGGKQFDAGADYDIYVINADGTGRTALTGGPGNDTDPTWQRVVPLGYPRPKAATRITLSLVPAFDRCTAPNRTHGPPLAHESCNPPDQASDFATVGTPDANGHAPKSTGSVTLRALTGDPATAADEADVRIRVSVSDVRERGGAAAPYPWSLWTRLPIRLTDEDSGCCGFPATLRDELLLNVETPCAASSDPQAGSTCAVTTTADTIIPGVVREGVRATWQLARTVQVYDAGPDFGGADSTLFATQGLFVP